MKPLNWFSTYLNEVLYGTCFIELNNGESGLGEENAYRLKTFLDNDSYTSLFVVVSKDKKIILSFEPPERVEGVTYCFHKLNGFYIPSARIEASIMVFGYQGDYLESMYRIYHNYIMSELISNKSLSNNTSTQVVNFFMTHDAYLNMNGYDGEYIPLYVPEFFKAVLKYRYEKIRDNVERQTASKTFEANFTLYVSNILKVWGVQITAFLQYGFYKIKKTKEETEQTDVYKNYFNCIFGKTKGPEVLRVASYFNNAVTAIQRNERDALFERLSIDKKIDTITRNTDIVYFSDNVFRCNELFPNLEEQRDRILSLIPKNYSSYFKILDCMDECSKTLSQMEGAYAQFTPKIDDLYLRELLDPSENSFVLMYYIWTRRLNILKSLKQQYTSVLIRYIVGIFENSKSGITTSYNKYLKMLTESIEEAREICCVMGTILPFLLKIHTSVSTNEGNTDDSEKTLFTYRSTTTTGIFRIFFHVIYLALQHTNKMNVSQLNNIIGYITNDLIIASRRFIGADAVFYECPDKYLENLNETKTRLANYKHSYLYYKNEKFPEFAHLFNDDLIIGKLDVFNEQLSKLKTLIEFYIDFYPLSLSTSLDFMSEFAKNIISKINGVFAELKHYKQSYTFTTVISKCPNREKHMKFDTMDQYKLKMMSYKFTDFYNDFMKYFGNREGQITNYIYDEMNHTGVSTAALKEYLSQEGAIGLRFFFQWDLVYLFENFFTLKSLLNRESVYKSAFMILSLIIKTYIDSCDAILRASPGSFNDIRCLADLQPSQFLGDVINTLFPYYGAYGSQLEFIVFLTYKISMPIRLISSLKFLNNTELMLQAVKAHEQMESYCLEIRTQMLNNLRNKISPQYVTATLRFNLASACDAMYQSFVNNEQQPLVYCNKEQDNLIKYIRLINTMEFRNRLLANAVFKYEYIEQTRTDVAKSGDRKENGQKSATQDDKVESYTAYQLERDFQLYLKTVSDKQIQHNYAFRALSNAKYSNGIYRNVQKFMSETVFPNVTYVIVKKDEITRAMYYYFYAPILDHSDFLRMYLQNTDVNLREILRKLAILNRLIYQTNSTHLITHITKDKLNNVFKTITSILAKKDVSLEENLVNKIQFEIADTLFSHIHPHLSIISDNISFIFKMSYELKGLLLKPIKRIKAFRLRNPLERLSDYLVTDSGAHVNVELSQLRTETIDIKELPEQLRGQRFTFDYGNKDFISFISTATTSITQCPNTPFTCLNKLFTLTYRGSFEEYISTFTSLFNKLKGFFNHISSVFEQYLDNACQSLELPPTSPIFNYICNYTLAIFYHGIEEYLAIYLILFYYSTSGDFPPIFNISYIGNEEDFLYFYPSLGNNNISNVVFQSASNRGYNCPLIENQDTSLSNEVTLHKSFMELLANTFSLGNLVRQLRIHITKKFGTEQRNKDVARDAAETFFEYIDPVCELSNHESTIRNTTSSQQEYTDESVGVELSKSSQRESRKKPQSLLVTTTIATLKRYFGEFAAKNFYFRNINCLYGITLLKIVNNMEAAIEYAIDTLSDFTKFVYAEEPISIKLDFNIVPKNPTDLIGILEEFKVRIEQVEAVGFRAHKFLDLIQAINSKNRTVNSMMFNVTPRNAVVFAKKDAMMKVYLAIKNYLEVLERSVQFVFDIYTSLVVSSRSILMVTTFMEPNMPDELKAGINDLFNQLSLVNDSYTRKGKIHRVFVANIKLVDKIVGGNFRQLNSKEGLISPHDKFYVIIILLIILSNIGQETHKLEIFINSVITKLQAYLRGSNIELNSETIQQLKAFPMFWRLQCVFKEIVEKLNQTYKEKVVAWYETMGESLNRSLIGLYHATLQDKDLFIESRSFGDEEMNLQEEARLAKVVEKFEPALEKAKAKLANILQLDSMFNVFSFITGKTLDRSSADVYITFIANLSCILPVLKDGLGLCEEIKAMNYIDITSETLSRMREFSKTRSQELSKALNFYVSGNIFTQGESIKNLQNHMKLKYIKFKIKPFKQNPKEKFPLTHKNITTLLIKSPIFKFTKQLLKKIYMLTDIITLTKHFEYKHWFVLTNKIAHIYKNLDIMKLIKRKGVPKDVEHIPASLLFDLYLHKHIHLVFDYYTQIFKTIFTTNDHQDIIRYWEAVNINLLLPSFMEILDTYYMLNLVMPAKYDFINRIANGVNTCILNPFLNDNNILLTIQNHIAALERIEVNDKEQIKKIMKNFSIWLWKYPILLLNLSNILNFILRHKLPLSYADRYRDAYVKFFRKGGIDFTKIFDRVKIIILLVIKIEQTIGWHRKEIYKFADEINIASTDYKNIVKSQLSAQRFELTNNRSKLKDQYPKTEIFMKESDANETEDISVSEVSRMIATHQSTTESAVSILNELYSDFTSFPSPASSLFDITATNEFGIFTQTYSFDINTLVTMGIKISVDVIYELKQFIKSQVLWNERYNTDIYFNSDVDQYVNDVFHFFGESLRHPIEISLDIKTICGLFDQISKSFKKYGDISRCTTQLYDWSGPMQASNRLTKIGNISLTLNRFNLLSVYHSHKGDEQHSRNEDILEYLYSTSPFGSKIAVVWSSLFTNVVYTNKKKDRVAVAINTTFGETVPLICEVYSPSIHAPLNTSVDMSNMIQTAIFRELTSSIEAYSLSMYKTMLSEIFPIIIAAIDDKQGSDLFDHLNEFMPNENNISTRDDLSKIGNLPISIIVPYYSNALNSTTTMVSTKPFISIALAIGALIDKIALILCTYGNGSLLQGNGNDHMHVEMLKKLLGIIYDVCHTLLSFFINLGKTQVRFEGCHPVPVGYISSSRFKLALIVGFLNMLSDHYRKASESVDASIDNSTQSVNVLYSYIKCNPWKALLIPRIDPFFMDTSEHSCASDLFSIIKQYSFEPEVSIFSFFNDEDHALTGKCAAEKTDHECTVSHQDDMECKVPSPVISLIENTTLQPIADEEDEQFEQKDERSMIHKPGFVVITTKDQQKSDHAESPLTLFLDLLQPHLEELKLQTNCFAVHEELFRREIDYLTSLSPQIQQTVTWFKDVGEDSNTDNMPIIYGFIETIHRIMLLDEIFTAGSAAKHVEKKQELDEVSSSHNSSIIVSTFDEPDMSGPIDHSEHAEKDGFNQGLPIIMKDKGLLFLMLQLPFLCQMEVRFTQMVGVYHPLPSIDILETIYGNSKEQEQEVIQLYSRYTFVKEERKEVPEWIPHSEIAAQQFYLKTVKQGFSFDEISKYIIMAVLTRLTDPGLINISEFPFGIKLTQNVKTLLNYIDSIFILLDPAGLVPYGNQADDRDVLNVDVSSVMQEDSLLESTHVSETMSDSTIEDNTFGMFESTNNQTITSEDSLIDATLTSSNFEDSQLDLPKADMNIARTRFGFTPYNRYTFIYKELAMIFGNPNATAGNISEMLYSWLRFFTKLDLCLAGSTTIKIVSPRNYIEPIVMRIIQRIWRNAHTNVSSVTTRGAQPDSLLLFKIMMNGSSSRVQLKGDCAYHPGSVQEMISRSSKNYYASSISKTETNFRLPLVIQSSYILDDNDVNSVNECLRPYFSRNNICAPQMDIMATSLHSVLISDDNSKLDRIIGNNVPSITMPMTDADTLLLFLLSNWRLRPSTKSIRKLSITEGYMFSQTNQLGREYIFSLICTPLHQILSILQKYLANKTVMFNFTKQLIAMVTSFFDALIISVNPVLLRQLRQIMVNTVCIYCFFWTLVSYYPYKDVFIEPPTVKQKNGFNFKNKWEDIWPQIINAVTDKGVTASSQGKKDDHRYDSLNLNDRDLEELSQSNAGSGNYKASSYDDYLLPFYNIRMEMLEEVSSLYPKSDSPLYSVPRFSIIDQSRIDFTLVPWFVIANKLFMFNAVSPHFEQDATALSNSEGEIRDNNSLTNTGQNEQNANDTGEKSISQCAIDMAPYLFNTLLLMHNNSNIVIPLNKRAINFSALMFSNILYMFSDKYNKDLLNMYNTPDMWRALSFSQDIHLIMLALLINDNVSFSAFDVAHKEKHNTSFAIFETNAFADLEAPRNGISSLMTLSKYMEKQYESIFSATPNDGHAKDVKIKAVDNMVTNVCEPILDSVLFHFDIFGQIPSNYNNKCMDKLVGDIMIENLFNMNCVPINEGCYVPLINSTHFLILPQDCVTTDKLSNLLLNHTMLMQPFPMNGLITYLELVLGPIVYSSEFKESCPALTIRKIYDILQKIIDMCNTRIGEVVFQDLEIVSIASKFKGFISDLDYTYDNVFMALYSSIAETLCYHPLISLDFRDELLGKSVLKVFGQKLKDIEIQNNILLEHRLLFFNEKATSSVLDPYEDYLEDVGRSLFTVRELKHDIIPNGLISQGNLTIPFGTNMTFIHSSLKPDFYIDTYSELMTEEECFDMFIRDFGKLFESPRYVQNFEFSNISLLYNVIVILNQRLFSPIVTVAQLGNNEKSSYSIEANPIYNPRSAIIIAPQELCLYQCIQYVTTKVTNYLPINFSISVNGNNNACILSLLKVILDAYIFVANTGLYSVVVIQEPVSITPGLFHIIEDLVKYSYSPLLMSFLNNEQIGRFMTFLQISPLLKNCKDMNYSLSTVLNEAGILEHVIIVALLNNDKNSIDQWRNYSPEFFRSTYFLDFNYKLKISDVYESIQKSNKFIEHDDSLSQDMGSANVTLETLFSILPYEIDTVTINKVRLNPEMYNSFDDILNNCKGVFARDREKNYIVTSEQVCCLINVIVPHYTMHAIARVIFSCIEPQEAHKFVVFKWLFYKNIFHQTFLAVENIFWNNKLIAKINEILEVIQRSKSKQLLASQNYNNNNNVLERTLGGIMNDYTQLDMYKKTMSSNEENVRKYEANIQTDKDEISELKNNLSFITTLFNSLDLKTAAEELKQFEPNEKYDILLHPFINVLSGKSLTDITYGQLHDTIENTEVVSLKMKLFIESDMCPDLNKKSYYELLQLLDLDKPCPIIVEEDSAILTDLELPFHLNPCLVKLNTLNLVSIKCVLPLVFIIYQKIYVTVSLQTILRRLEINQLVLTQYHNEQESLNKSIDITTKRIEEENRNYYQLKEVSRISGLKQNKYETKFEVSDEMFTQLTELRDSLENKTSEQRKGENNILANVLVAMLWGILDNGSCVDTEQQTSLLRTIFDVLSQNGINISDELKARLLKPVFTCDFKQILQRHKRMNTNSFVLMTLVGESCFDYINATIAKCVRGFDPSIHEYILKRLHFRHYIFRMRQRNDMCFIKLVNYLLTPSSFKFNFVKNPFNYEKFTFPIVVFTKKDTARDIFGDMANAIMKTQHCILSCLAEKSRSVLLDGTTKIKIPTSTSNLFYRVFVNFLTRRSENISFIQQLLKNEHISRGNKLERVDRFLIDSEEMYEYTIMLEGGETATIKTYFPVYLNILLDENEIGESQTTGQLLEMSGAVEETDTTSLITSTDEDIIKHNEDMDRLLAQFGEYTMQNTSKSLSFDNTYLELIRKYK